MYSVYKVDYRGAAAPNKYEYYASDTYSKNVC